MTNPLILPTIEKQDNIWPSQKYGLGKEYEKMDKNKHPGYRRGHNVTYDACHLVLIYHKKIKELKRLIQMVNNQKCKDTDLKTNSKENKDEKIIEMMKALLEDDEIEERRYTDLLIRL